MNDSHAETGQKSPENPPQQQAWNDLYERSVRIFDQWLNQIEEALPETVPDLRKNSELVNLFTVLRRMLEIRQIQLKLAHLEEDENDGETDHRKQIEADKALDEAIRLLDPELFGEEVSQSVD